MQLILVWNVQEVLLAAAVIVNALLAEKEQRVPNSSRVLSHATTSCIAVAASLALVGSLTMLFLWWVEPAGPPLS